MPVVFNRNHWIFNKRTNYSLNTYWIFNKRNEIFNKCCEVLVFNACIEMFNKMSAVTFHTIAFRLFCSFPPQVADWEPRPMHHTCMFWVHNNDCFSLWNEMNSTGANTNRRSEIRRIVEEVLSERSSSSCNENVDQNPSQNQTRQSSQTRLGMW